MQRFEESVEIATSATAVWDVLTDPAHLASWLTIARDVRADGAPDTGQVLTVTGGHLGVSRTVTAEVDVWEPPARYGWSVHDPVPLRFRYGLHDGDGEVRLTATVEADLHGLPRAATNLAVRSLRRELGRSLVRLRDLVVG